jgi:hypothetical protein
VIVDGGHKLKINPKHLSYNSLHYDLKDKVGNPKSKWFGHTYFAADLDDNPHTEDNTGILDRYKNLVELDAVSVLNDMQSLERTARAIPRSCDICCVQGYRSENREGFHALAV